MIDVDITIRKHEYLSHFDYVISLVGIFCFVL